MLKTRNILAAFVAAACTAAAVTSQAATLFCYTPSLNFFDGVFSSGPSGDHTVVLTCESIPNQGNPKTAKAIGGGSGDTILINLITGTRARIGGYNSNRQGINCFKEDFTTGGDPEGKNCAAGQLAFYDMSVEG